jgi:DNA-directed RNA polymerase subunit M/transcription elongation factor TFIIS
VNPGSERPTAPPASSGTGVSKPASDSPGRTIDSGRGRVFPCEQCGAELLFNIGDQKLKCPHCGFEKEIAPPANAVVAEQDFAAMVDQLQKQATSRNAEQQQEETHNEVRCEGCGANIVFAGTLTSTDCPYCGCPVQREHIHKGGWRIPVDGLLAFVVTREQAANSLANWVRTRWFAPNEFKKRGANGKFNGVYLPFWTFDAMAAVAYDGQRGEHYYETVKRGDQEETVQRTRWWPVSGQFQRFFDDILVAATGGIRRNLIDGLRPWPLQNCRPFTPEVLAGFVSRTYDVELEAGFTVATAEMDSAIGQEVRERIGGDEQQVNDIRRQFSAITFKHVLLPVWMLAYNYRDKTYQVLVNACTGEVDGERPYSPWKIAFAALLGVLATLSVVYLSQHK